mmetsp:Transcript_8464/g.38498  ORF Transcript_8464/g.38498 Transcript_8464/m.38498 type:complete len:201 (+) Transcript_8464:5853-6455(+)
MSEPRHAPGIHHLERRDVRDHPSLGELARHRLRVVHHHRARLRRAGGASRRLAPRGDRARDRGGVCRARERPFGVHRKHVTNTPSRVATRNLRDPPAEEHHPERHRRSLDRTTHPRVAPRVPGREGGEPRLRRAFRVVAARLAAHLRLEVTPEPERRTVHGVPQEHADRARGRDRAHRLELLEDAWIRCVLRAVRESKRA